MEQKIFIVPSTRAPRPIELPSAFLHLQHFVGWSLATETERNIRRHQVTMDEITEFANAMLAEVDAIVEYLDAFTSDAMPADAQALMYMLLSLAEIGPAVEFYRQPAVIDGYDPRRFIAEENFALKPAF